MSLFVRRVLVTGLLAIALSATDGCAVDKPVDKKVLDFEKSEPGTMPAGFTAALTGEGGAVAWMIAEDPTAPSPPKILAQSSTETTDYRFPLCIYDGVTAKDVAASVRFKAVQGNVDRAAGLAVRLQDPDDYYVVRANAREDDVRLYKVVGGKRSEITGKKVTVSPEAWHTLGLEARGHHLVVSFDGRRLFEADDATFPRAGKVALWTKADSVTFFDNLEIEPHDRRAR